jgi:hypothetical protein
MNFDTMKSQGVLRFSPANRLLHVPVRIPKSSHHAAKNFERVKSILEDQNRPGKHHFYLNLGNFVVDERVRYDMCDRVAHAAMQKGHKLSLEVPDESTLGACHDMKLEHLALRKYNKTAARIFKVYQMNDSNAEHVFFQLQADLMAAPAHIGIHLKHDISGIDTNTVANFSEACHIALDRCYKDKIDVRLLIEVASDEVYDSIRDALMLYGQDMYYKIKIVSNAAYTLPESIGFSEMHAMPA